MGMSVLSEHRWASSERPVESTWGMRVWGEVFFQVVARRRLGVGAQQLAVDPVHEHDAAVGIADDDARIDVVQHQGEKIHQIAQVGAAPESTRMAEPAMPPLPLSRSAAQKRSLLSS